MENSSACEFVTHLCLKIINVLHPHLQLKADLTYNIICNTFFSNMHQFNQCSNAEKLTNLEAETVTIEQIISLSHKSESLYSICQEIIDLYEELCILRKTECRIDHLLYICFQLIQDLDDSDPKKSSVSYLLGNENTSDFSVISSSSLCYPSSYETDTQSKSFSLFSTEISENVSSTDYSYLPLPEFDHPFEIRIPRSSSFHQDEGYVTPEFENIDRTPDNTTDLNLKVDKWMLKQQTNSWAGLLGCANFEKPSLSNFDDCDELFEKTLWISKSNSIKDWYPTDPTVISVPDFITDIKYLLMGVSSNTFQLLSMSKNFCLTPNIKVLNVSNDFLKVFVEEFIICGNASKQLDYLSSCVTKVENGLVFTTLCQTVTTYLECMRNVILNLDLSNVLLSSVSFVTKPIRDQIIMVSNACRGFNEPKPPVGGQIIDQFFKELQCIPSSQEAYSIYAILHPCLSIYFTFLYKWIFKGIIEDAYQEFFIDKRFPYIISNSRSFWSRGFVCMERLLPSFLADLKEEIFACGKTVCLLKLCDPDNPLLRAVEESGVELKICNNYDSFDLLQDEMKKYHSHCIKQLGSHLQFSFKKDKDSEKKLLETAKHVREKNLKLFEEKRKKKLEEIADKKFQQLVELKSQIDELKLKKEQERQLKIEAERKWIEQVKKEHELDMISEQLKKAKIEEFYKSLLETSQKKVALTVWKINRTKLTEQRVSYFSKEKHNLLTSLELKGKEFKESSDESRSKIELSVEGASDILIKPTWNEKKENFVENIAEQSKQCINEVAVLDLPVDERENVPSVASEERGVSETSDSLQKSSSETIKSKLGGKNLLVSDLFPFSSDLEEFKKDVKNISIPKSISIEDIGVKSLKNQSEKVYSDSIVEQNELNFKAWLSDREQALKNAVKSQSSDLNSVMSTVSKNDESANTKFLSRAINSKYAEGDSNFSENQSKSKQSRNINYDSIVFEGSKITCDSTAVSKVVNESNLEKLAESDPSSIVESNVSDESINENNVEKSVKSDPSSAAESNVSDESITKNSAENLVESDPSSIAESNVSDKFIKKNKVEKSIKSDSSSAAENNVSEESTTKNSTEKSVESDLSSLAENNVLDKLTPVSLSNTGNKSDTNISASRSRSEETNSTVSTEHQISDSQKLEIDSYLNNLDSLPLKVDILEQIFSVSRSEVHKELDSADIDVSIISSLCIESIRLPLKVQTIIANYSLMKYFIDKLQLVTHLNVMKNYFMLHNANFRSHFISNVHKTLRYHKGLNMNSLDFSFVLAEALMYSSHEESDFSQFLAISVEDPPSVLDITDPKIFNSFSLHYTVEWPLNLILTPEAISKYNMIFKFFLKAMYVDWILIQQFKYLSNQNLKSSPQHKQICLFRHSMTQFIHPFVCFFSESIVEGNFNHLLEELEKDSCLDSIYYKHVEFVKSVIFNCFLTAKSEIVLNAFNMLFKNVLHFNEALLQGSWEFDRQSEQMVHSNFDKLQSYFHDFTVLSLDTGDFLRKLVDSGYQIKLNNLINQISFNSFFSRKERF